MLNLWNSQNIFGMSAFYTLAGMNHTSLSQSSLMADVPAVMSQFSTKRLVMSQNVWPSQSSPAPINVQWRWGQETVESRLRAHRNHWETKEDHEVLTTAQCVITPAATEEAGCYVLLSLY